MKKKLKYVAVVVGIVLLILLIGVIGYRVYHRIQLSKFMDVKTEKLYLLWENKIGYSLEDIDSLEEKDNNVCVVYSNKVESKYNVYKAYTQICPFSYFFFPKLAYKGKTVKDKESGNWRFIVDYSLFDVDLYDIKTQAYVKTIDVAKILDQYPEYEAYCQYEIFWFDNKENLAIKMMLPDKRAYDGETNKWLLIDLETEESELCEYDLLSYDENDSIIAEELKAWREKNKLIVDEGDDTTNETVEYTFIVGKFNNWPEMINMSISTNQLPKENDKLYEMFPKLKDYIGLDGYSTTLILKEEVAKELFLGE